MFSGMQEKSFLAVLLLVLVGGLIYSNTLNVPFYFDDINNITNPALRVEKISFDEFSEVMSTATLRTRPVSNASFALNYYFGGYRVQGYHLVNICIHLLTGIFLFFLLKFTLALPVNNKQYSGFGGIAFLASLVWIVHPVATQSVTYIVQRMNSMAAMFFVLTLLLYVCGRNRQLRLERRKSVLAPWWYFSASIVAGILAVGSKEIAVTLPVILFFYEWFFFQKLSRRWLQKKIVWLLTAFSVIALFAGLYLGPSFWQIFSSDCQGRDFTSYERLLTQFRVVLHYIGLLLYPSPDRLVLDYNFPVSTSLFDPLATLVSFLIIVLVLLCAVIFARREPLLSFCVLWFFCNLLIESSVICLEMVFEHRTYLPSMFFYLFLLAGLYRLFNNKLLIGGVICLGCVVFSWWTYERNEMWQDPVKFWYDAAAKSPGKARVYSNLGQALIGAERFTEAEQQIRLAIEADPSSEISLNNMGALFAVTGRKAEAEHYFREALGRNPAYVNSLISLGIFLRDNGQVEEAQDKFREILKIFPEDVFANKNLGNLLLRNNQPADALSYLEKALSKIPKDTEVILDIGESLMRLNRLQEAEASYFDVLAINSNSMPAHYNLGLLLAHQGKEAEALVHYRSAVRLMVPSSSVLYNYGNMLSRSGQLEEAKLMYEKSLDNDLISNTYNNLGTLMLRQAKYSEAVMYFSKALCIAPEHKLAEENLGWAQQQLELSRKEISSPDVDE